MKSTGDMVLRGLGLALGLAAATSLVLSSRIPPGSGTLGADVIVASAPTGELGVSPTGPFLSATNLSPGRDVVPSGTLEVTNQTGIDLRVQIRGVPSTTDMDDELHVRVEAGDTQVFDGSVASFRSWSTTGFSLASGETRDVEVRTWIEPGADAWSGRIANVALEFRSIPEGDPA